MTTEIFKKRTITVDVDLPHFWEPTNEYRAPKRGEVALTCTGEVIIAAWDWTTSKAFILRPSQSDQKDNGRLN